MDHKVEFVGDGDLPEGVEWALYMAPGEAVVLFVESALCPRVLEEAWEAYRTAIARPFPVPVQSPRTLRAVASLRLSEVGLATGTHG